ncbi:hypothetical protein ACFPES_06715 [Paenibacillus sp. GCM10023248]|nr:hypothetical protein [Paenibacillus sp. MAHUQ-63]
MPKKLFYCSRSVETEFHITKYALGMAMIFFEPRGTRGSRGTANGHSGPYSAGRGRIQLLTDTVALICPFSACDRRKVGK